MSWNFLGNDADGETMMRTQVPEYVFLLMPSVSSLFTDIGGFCEFGKCACPHTSNPSSAVIILHRESKKGDTILLSISSLNIDRFS